MNKFKSDWSCLRAELEINFAVVNLFPRAARRNLFLALIETPEWANSFEEEKLCKGAVIVPWLKKATKCLVNVTRLKIRYFLYDFSV